MAGLRKICKLYGSMTVNGQEFVWDYANDEPVPKSEMPHGSERHARSERAKWAGAASTANQETSANRPLDTHNPTA